MKSIKTLKTRIYPSRQQIKQLKQMAKGVDEIWNHLNQIQQNRMKKFAKIELTKNTADKNENEQKYRITNYKESFPLEVPYKDKTIKIREKLGIILPWQPLTHYAAQYTPFGMQIKEKYNLYSKINMAICRQFAVNIKNNISTAVTDFVEHDFKLKDRNNKENWIPFDPGTASVKTRNRINIFGLDIKTSKDNRELYALLNDENAKISAMGKLTSGSITVDKFKKWWLQIAIETKEKTTHVGTDIVGIDPGFNTCITLSDGRKFKRPEELKILQQKRRLLMKKASKSKGGKQRIITQKINGVQHNVKYSPSRHILKKARKLENHITNKKRHWEREVAKDVVSTSKEIYFGNPNIKAMKKVYGKSVQREAIFTLRDAIKNRADRFGVKVDKIDEKYTTVMCNQCKEETGPKGQKALGVRKWTCSKCGAMHDRDVNAAINIKNKGLAESLVPKKNNKKINKQK